MSKKDNDNSHQFHITLNAYDRRALEFVRNVQGAISRSKAMRVCIRAAALQLGYKGVIDEAHEIYKK